VQTNEKRIFPAVKPHRKALPSTNKEKESLPLPNGQTVKKILFPATKSLIKQLSFQETKKL